MKESLLLHPHDHKTVRDWRRILAFLDQSLQSVPQSVLDVGGGFGNIACHYAARGARSVVLDIDESCLARARSRNAGIRTECRDINAPLPWDDGLFDLVACTGALHYGYVRDTAAIITEMARVSRRYVLIDILSRYSPYRFIERLYNPLYNPRTYSSRDSMALFDPYLLRVRARTSTKSIPLFAELFPFTGKTVYYLLEKNAL